MSVIRENFGSGGANLVPNDGQGSPTLADALRDVADDLKDVAGSKAEGSGIVDGMYAKDPTTPSTQATGAGATDWNVDIQAGVVEVNAVLKDFATQADFDIHSGSLVDAGFVVGTSIVAAVVAKEVAGTVSMDKVIGTPATTGSEVAPTDAEIQAAVGAGNKWGKICECTLNRTADTTVTESTDWTVRDRSLGVGGQPIRTTKA